MEYIYKVYKLGTVRNYNNKIEQLQQKNKLTDFQYYGWGATETVQRLSHFACILTDLGFIPSTAHGPQSTINCDSWVYRQKSWTLPGIAQTTLPTSKRRL